MSLIVSAITPHPPILIPSIGKDNLNRLKATQKSFQKLADLLFEKNIETILIISPHGVVQSNAFTMNLNPKFSCNFSSFGDFSTKKLWTGNVGLTHKIRERLETKAPLQLTSEDDLDHGVSVPLILLTEKIPNVKIIPLYYSGLNYEAHFKFGQLLKREILVNDERIAVISSGDLSHRLTKDAPAGYSPKGKKFDKKLIELLKNNKTNEIINIDEELINEAGECGLKSIIIQQGIMDGIKHTPKMLSYESPFGVGYLVMNFEI